MQSSRRIAGLICGLCLAFAAAQKPSDEEVENAIQSAIRNDSTLGPG